MSDWGDGWDDLVVEVDPGSPSAPDGAGRGLVPLVVVAAAAVVGLGWFLLAAGDDTVTDEQVSPEPSATVVPTPDGDGDGDDESEADDVGRFDVSVRGLTEVVTADVDVGDGSSCVAFRSPRIDLTGACFGWPPPAGEPMSWTVAASGSQWCVVGGVDADHDQVEVTYTDGTRSRLDLHPQLPSTMAVFADCRVDPVGLAGLRASGPGGTVDERGGLRAGAGPLVGVPVVFPEADGWFRSRLDSVAVLSRHPVYVPPVSERNGGLCHLAQETALIEARADAVVVMAVAIEADLGLGPRDRDAAWEPVALGPSRVGPVCPRLAENLEARRVRFGEGRRTIEMAVISGPEADPADVVAAERFAAEAHVVAVDDDGADAGLGLAPPLGNLDPLAVWTGDELVIWGGFRQYVASVFDVDLVGWVEGEAYGRPVVFRRVDTGAAYDPASGTWRELAPAPQLDGALDPYALGARGVWTGTEVLMWPTGFGGPGLGYRPDTDQWRVLADQGALGIADPRGAALAWTGSEAVSLADYTTVRGDDRENTFELTAYDPVADSWRRVTLDGGRTVPIASDLWDIAGAVVVGEEIVYVLTDGAVVAVDPTAGQMRELTPVFDAGGRGVADIAVAGFGGGVAVVVSGLGGEGMRAFIGDAPFETWTPVDLGARSRQIDTVVAVGDDLVVRSVTWGGSDEPTWSAQVVGLDGAVSDLTLTEAARRCGPAAVALDDAVALWGGFDCTNGDAFTNGTVIDLAQ